MAKYEWIIRLSNKSNENIIWFIVCMLKNYIIVITNVIVLDFKENIIYLKLSFHILKYLIFC